MVVSEIRLLQSLSLSVCKSSDLIWSELTRVKAFFLSPPFPIWLPQPSMDPDELFVAVHIHTKQPYRRLVTDRKGVGTSTHPSLMGIAMAQRPLLPFLCSSIACLLVSIAVTTPPPDTGVVWVGSLLNCGHESMTYPPCSCLKCPPASIPRRRKLKGGHKGDGNLWKLLPCL